MASFAPIGRGDTAKSDTQKPKADEKAYAQAIGSLTDKSYDPWTALTRGWNSLR